MVPESTLDDLRSDTALQESDTAGRSGIPVAGTLPARPPLADQFAMLVAVVVPFLGTLVAAALFWTHGGVGWLHVGLLVGGWLATGLGITIGFHRLLTHRGFETYALIRAFWMAMGAMAIEGSPLVWCAIHRRHHEHSDLPGDPHSPHPRGGGWNSTLRGLWNAQVGWLFAGYWSDPQLRRYVPDLLAEPSLVWVDRYYYLFVLISLAIPTAIAGLVGGGVNAALMGLLWGGLVRVFLTHHITWSINSICHVYGSRMFRTADGSTNNALCGILGLGEGWHNNHHAFPTSARHGLAWWQFDASWLVIRLMQACRLAWDVKLPSPKAIAARRI